jgi:Signal recognition particle GTPase
MMVSTDVYRPAAMEQLAHLGKDIEVEVFPSRPDQQPVQIAKDALEAAQRGVFDVLIVDTAGRLHVDDAMMAEAQALTGAVQPVELLFVVDAMTGQDAVNTAKAFNDALPLTGVILTKADGDARGGAPCRCGPLPASPSSLWVLVKKSARVWNLFIRIDWLRVFWAWAILSAWLSRSNRMSMLSKRRK